MGEHTLSNQMTPKKFEKPRRLSVTMKPGAWLRSRTIWPCRESSMLIRKLWSHPGCPNQSKSQCTSIKQCLSLRLLAIKMCSVPKSVEEPKESPFLLFWRCIHLWMSLEHMCSLPRKRNSGTCKRNRKKHAWRIQVANREGEVQQYIRWGDVAVCQVQGEG